MSSIFLHTVGGATLDNLYPMLYRTSNVEEAAKQSIETQLDLALNTDGSERHYEVISHAYYGFSLSSILKGGFVGKMLNFTPFQKQLRKEQVAYLNQKHISLLDYYGKKVEPLKNLKKFIKEKPQDTHYLVISIEDLGFKNSLFFSSSPFFLLENISTPQSLAIRIIEKANKLKKENPNIRPILIFPFKAFFSFWRSRLKTVGVISMIVHALCIAGIMSSASVLLTRKIQRQWNVVPLLTSAILLCSSSQIIFLIHANARYFSRNYLTQARIGFIFFTTINVFSIAGMMSSTFVLLKKTIPSECSVFPLLSSAILFALNTRIISLKGIGKILTGQEEISTAALRGLMGIYYEPIARQAKIDKIPILNFSNIVEPQSPGRDNSDPLGGPDIKGGELIARGIAHIVKNHHFDSESMVYSQTPNTESLTFSSNIRDS